MAMRDGLEAGQPEVGDHHRADEQLEDQQELALLNQVGLAGLVDQRRDVGHRLVDRQVLHRRVGPHAEQQPEHADDQARQQDLMAGHAQEVALVEVGQLDVDLAAGAVRCVLGLRRQQRRRHQHRQRKDHGHSLNKPHRHRVVLILSVHCRALTVPLLVTPCRPLRKSGCLLPPTNPERAPWSRGYTDHVTEIQVIGRHVHRHHRFRPVAAIERELPRQEPSTMPRCASSTITTFLKPASLSGENAATSCFTGA